jgi:Flp pilus assembly pilin Flp
MTQFIGKWRQFLDEQSGAMAIEYGLIAGGMLLAIYPAFYLITSSVSIKFQDVANAFNFFK